MTNPFDDADSSFLALVNGEGCYSLWPEYQPVPAGWQVAFGPAPRESVITHIDTHWVDVMSRGVANIAFQADPASTHPVSVPQ